MSSGTDDLIAALEPLTSRVRTDVTAIKGEFGMAWTREELTRVRLKRHVEGTLARGVCPIRAGESTTRVAVFDLDSHKGETGWKRMVEIAAALCSALEAKGYRPVVFRSSGGRGIHIFLIWDEPQDAYSVRWGLDRGVLWPLGFKNGAKGVAAGEIEVFPKQDQVPEHGFGNQFILPLFGKSAPLEPLADYEVMPREYAPQLRWTPSDPVPVVERPERAPAIGATPDDLRVLERALAFIPNDTDPLGYDDWRDMVSGIHHASSGSEEGYELAYAFSSRAPHFDETELRVKVWDWLSNKGPADNPVTARTVLAKAREHGWQDVASPDDFDDVSVPVEGEGQIALPSPKFSRDANGRIDASAMHLRQALARPDFCRMDIRFDEFRHELVYAPDDEPGAWRPFVDHHYFELRLTLEARGFKGLGKEMLRDAVHHRAKTCPVDTAMMWLDSLTWDGVPRVASFFASYFGVADTPYARAVGRYTWSALAGRVLVPGMKADMVPILAGDQGLGKTSGVEAMAPADTFREMSFHENEESRARKMRGALVAELAELTGLKSRDREEIKAWISRRREEWVPKYQEFTTRLERRLLFIATSNPTNLLDDPTGERRWLPMVCSKVDAEGIARDRDQLWAEGRALFEDQGVIWAEAARLATAEHGAFRDEDTWEDALWEWANSEKLGGGRILDEGFTTQEALSEGLGFRQSAVKRGEQLRCAQALRHLGFETKALKTAGGRAERRSVRRWVYTRAGVYAVSTDLA